MIIRPYCWTCWGSCSMNGKTQGNKEKISQSLIMNLSLLRSMMKTLRKMIVSSMIPRRNQRKSRQLSKKKWISNGAMRMNWTSLSRIFSPSWTYNKISEIVSTSSGKQQSWSWNLSQPSNTELLAQYTLSLSYPAPAVTSSTNSQVNVNTAALLSTAPKN